MVILVIAYLVCLGTLTLCCVVLCCPPRRQEVWAVNPAAIQTNDAASEGESSRNAETAGGDV